MIFNSSARRATAPSEADATHPPAPDANPSAPQIAPPLTVLIVAPSVHAGAADAGTLELVRTLAGAGHRPIVASSGGRMVPEIMSAGGEFVPMRMASRNPLRVVSNAVALVRLVRERNCHVIHAHGRAPAWSAFYAARRTGIPFLTSWHKGFREQNVFKRFYNSVMVRGDRVIAASDQLADLIAERYGTPSDRISVIPACIDLDRFDPKRVPFARIDNVRRNWGVSRENKVILVVGRMLRRKGHPVVVQAVQRLKQMGLKDFVCVFVGDDARSRLADELWDLVLSTNTADVVRLAGPMIDLPAAYAAATVVVSAATQPEGLQRAILEAQAMTRPVIVSDVGAGPETVLAPPAVAEDRMTGLRFASGDPGALAAAIVHLFSLPEAARRAMGARGRAWVTANFDARAANEPMLRLYAEVGGSVKTVEKP